MEQYLIHHGIKGQKWGIRRYQNEDGSLTPAGRERYGVDLNGNMSEHGEKLYLKDKQKELKRKREQQEINSITEYSEKEVKEFTEKTKKEKVKQIAKDFLIGAAIGFLTGGRVIPIRVRRNTRINNKKQKTQPKVFTDTQKRILAERKQETNARIHSAKNPNSNSTSNTTTRISTPYRSTSYSYNPNKKTNPRRRY